MQIDPALSRPAAPRGILSNLSNLRHETLPVGPAPFEPAERFKSGKRVEISLKAV
jgi:hypothetical protein